MSAGNEITEKNEIASSKEIIEDFDRRLNTKTIEPL
jgi:hypothetical protein